MNQLRMLALGAAIKARRVVLCMSQNQLADLVDVSGDYISLLERGDRSPSLGLLEKISDACRWKMNHLFEVVDLLERGLHEDQ